MPHITHVNNILHSIFSNAYLYINNHQIYNSNGLYAHKSHISNNLKSTLSDYKVVLHFKGMTMEKVQRIATKLHFPLEEWNCTVDLRVLCCTVSLASTFLQLRNYYIQIWKYESE